MGLFDRFKRKVVEAEEDSGFTVDEGSPEAIEAIAQRDYPVVQGIVVIVSSLIVIISVIVDILVATIDPRIRY